MIYCCPLCTENPILRCYLENELYSEDDIDENDDSCIDKKQWKKTDRSELLSLTETTSSFIHTINKLQELTVYSYIAKSQAASLIKFKNELTSAEVIVLCNFAENYEFVLQDKIQSFHWNKIQVTLHPTGVYILKCNSMFHH